MDDLFDISQITTGNASDDIKRQQQFGNPGGVMVSVPTYEIVVDLVVLETQCEWKVLNRWHVIDLKMSA